MLIVGANISSRKTLNMVGAIVQTSKRRSGPVLCTRVSKRPADFIAVKKHRRQQRRLRPTDRAGLDGMEHVD